MNTVGCSYITEEGEILNGRMFLKWGYRRGGISFGVARYKSRKLDLA